MEEPYNKWDREKRRKDYQSSLIVFSLSYIDKFMSKNSSDIQQRRRLLCLHPQSSYIHKFVDTPSCAQEGVPKKEAAFHTKDPHLFVTCV